MVGLSMYRVDNRVRFAYDLYRVRHDIVHHTPGTSSHMELQRKPLARENHLQTQIMVKTVRVLQIQAIQINWP